ncbi:MAG: J domain-containing protein [Acidimicrobiales bacterium]
MDGSTALAVLGLEPGATKQQIKTTFRALVKGAHPDAFGVSSSSADSADAFVELRSAYEIALAAAPEALIDAHPPTNFSVAGVPVANVPATSVPVANVPVTDVPTSDRSLADVARPRRSGAWFTSTRPVTAIDITDVATTATGTLRASMVRGARPAVGDDEQLFASLLADELANA